MLTNSSSNKSFKDLGFHVNEIYYDLVGLIKSYENLSALNPDSCQEFLELRIETGCLCIAIEHDTTHHLAEALKLVGKIMENQSILQLGKNLSSLQIEADYRDTIFSNTRESDGYDSLLAGLRHLIRQLRLVLEKIAEVRSIQEKGTQFLEQLMPLLEDIASILAKQVYPYAVNLHLQAFWLQRVSDPESAKEEDYWQLIATPLREEIHPLANSLDSCPLCGASMTDCRTFTGSYCESCRTQWSQLPEL